MLLLCKHYMNWTPYLFFLSFYRLKTLSLAGNFTRKSVNWEVASYEIHGSLLQSLLRCSLLSFSFCVLQGEAHGRNKFNERIDSTQNLHVCCEVVSTGASSYFWGSIVSSITVSQHAFQRWSCKRTRALLLVSFLFIIPGCHLDTCGVDQSH